MTEDNNVVLPQADGKVPLSSIEDVSRAIGELCRNMARLKEEHLHASNDDRQVLESLIDTQLNTIAMYTAHLTRRAGLPPSGDASTAEAPGSPN